MGTPTAPGATTVWEAARESADSPGNAHAHVPALDGLRGIAIILVMLFHYFGAAQGTGFYDRFALGVMSLGWMGVDLFFALSGFLITGILYDAKKRARYFTNFYARRALRIFPLYYGVLVVLLIILPAIRPYRSEEMHDIVRSQAWLWLYAVNFARTFTAHQLDRVGHFWSLSIEEHFYLIWPAVIFFLSRRQLIGTALLACAAAIAVRLLMLDQGFKAAEFTFSRMDSLAVGALVALLARGPEGLSRYVGKARLTGGAAVALLLVAFIANGVDLRPLNPFVQQIGFSIIAAAMAAAVLLVVVSRPESRIHRLLASASLRSVGRYSYAMYVFHVPLAPLFWLLFSFEWLDINGRLHSGFLAHLPYAVLASLATYALAWVSWHAYEQHFLKLKRYFE